MAQTVCRYGIMGTAAIARKNWLAIRNAGNARLVAVASRDRERARSFIAGCQATVPLDPGPRALGSYEELLACEDVDAIYIPLPTALRWQWAVEAARAGKHVLCEKPCAASVAELESMVAACAAANVQFMDGVMWMHSRRLEPLRAVLDDPATLGEIRRIVSHFTFNAPDDFAAANIRMDAELEPLGCLGDLGWYTIGMCLWIMHHRLPTRVTGRLLQAGTTARGGAPVPVEFAGELLFDEGAGVSASFFTSFRTSNQQLVSVAGSHGSVRIDDFVLPHVGNELEFTVSQPAFVGDGCRFDMERHDRRVAVSEYASAHPTAQETNLFRTFAQLVIGGVPDPRWPAVSLAIQRVMMACVESADRGGVEVRLAD
jgi:predicted dehydrogenase